MEYVGGAIGGASGAALGFIAADVPGAWVGAKYGWQAGKNFAKNKETMPPVRRKRKSSMLTPPRTPKRFRRTSKVVPKKFKRKTPYVKKQFTKVVKKAAKKRLVTGVSQGSFAGKFAIPSKLTKSFENIALNLGYHITKESYGDCVDTDCAYIYHSNFIPNLIAKCLTGALVRTIFRKAGLEIGNQEQELPVYDSGSSIGYRLVYTYRDPITGNMDQSLLDTAENETFQSFVENLQTTNRLGWLFAQYIYNAANQFKEPYSLGLYTYDYNALITNYRLAAYMTLQDEFVVYEATSALMVQNRTQGSAATGTDLSLDRVDNQPLKGYLYQFKNGDPRLKTNQIKNTGVATNRDFLYSTGDTKGLRSYGSVQLVGPQAALMSEPPMPSIWRNVDASTKIQLDPGMMKKTLVISSYKARLPELLRKFRIDVVNLIAGTGNGYSQLPSHKSQILALEEMLRTPSANFITLLFENEYKVGCYTYTSKLKGTLRSDITEEEILQYGQ